MKVLILVNLDLLRVRDMTHLVQAKCTLCPLVTQAMRAQHWLHEHGDLSLETAGQWSEMVEFREKKSFTLLWTLIFQRAGNSAPNSVGF